MSALTQAVADLLYSALGHLHDDRYSLLDHAHDHGALAGLGDDDHGQYFNQSRGDARYALSALSGGWVLAAGAWTYASVNTILVPSGAGSVYTVGDGIRIVQTISSVPVTKYFFVVGVADTLLTVTGGTSFTLTNNTITELSFTKSGNAAGFPRSFNYAVALGAVSGTPPTIGAGSLTGKFTMLNGLMRYEAGFTFGAGATFGSGNSWWTLSIPWTNAGLLSGWGTCSNPATGYNFWPVVHGGAGGTNALGMADKSSAGGFIITTSPFTWAVGSSLVVSGIYGV